MQCVHMSMFVQCENIQLNDNTVRKLSLPVLCSSGSLRVKVTVKIALSLQCIGAVVSDPLQK